MISKTVTLVLSTLTIIALIGSSIIVNAGVLSEANKPGLPEDVLHNNTLAPPEFQEATAKVIRAYGYECPHLTMLWLVGNSPYGPKLEAMCGYLGGENSVKEWHYTVYPTKPLIVLCKPFGVFGGGCE
jgi:hypothetical protein